MSFTLYIHVRGKKPQKVGTCDGTIKDTIELDGKVYYWVTADLDAKTLTYSDRRPVTL